ncbi:uncharacterized protein LOC142468140 isoform X3 [Ascaphus truei]|uniref:uncharacterized protein LOC142468140 isoform X3 n=1 Tax=Ascaphus truei TaxID=8439 RepID=UPI003F5966EA
MQHTADSPMELLAGYLSKATDVCKSGHDFPAELITCLQKASDIVAEMKLSPEKIMEKEGHVCKNTLDEFSGEVKTTGIDVYKMLLHMTGAQNILHLHNCSSDDALALAELLPEDGKLVLCASEPYVQKLHENSSHGKKMQVKVGITADIVKKFAASGEQFDMIFIDATERNQISDYNLIMSCNMLKMNGVICVRSILVRERRSGGSDADGKGCAARQMAEMIHSDHGVEQVVLPVDCGISIVRRKHFSVAVDMKEGVVKDDVFWGLNGRGILDRLRLDGKVAYVTGGGQGIKSVAMAADISKEEDVKRVVDTIVANWGRIDIACNNAGINMNSASEDTTLDEWDRTFNVNLRGLFMCCQAAGRVMLNQGYGKIINTASMASLIVPHPQKQLAYNTSKAGVVKLTQTLGTEWIGRGVRVNCISPGIVDTPLIHSDVLKPLVQRWLDDIPAGRLAQVTDLQAAVVFMASEASDYMTGHNLVIEGGQSLW